MVSILRRILSVVDRILLGVCVTGLLTIVVTIAAGVIARRFFTAFAWTEELATFLFIIVAFLGAACCAFRRREIVVDFFLHKIPEKYVGIVNVITKVLVLIFMGMVFVGSILLQGRIVGTSVALSIPRVLYYVPIMVSSAVMFLIHGVDLLEMLLEFKKTKEGVK